MSACVFVWVIEHRTSRGHSSRLRQGMASCGSTCVAAGVEVKDSKDTACSKKFRQHEKNSTSHQFVVETSTLELFLVVLRIKRERWQGSPPCSPRLGTGRWRHGPPTSSIVRFIMKLQKGIESCPRGLIIVPFLLALFTKSIRSEDPGIFSCFLANAGDSRGLLVRLRQGAEPVNLGADHVGSEALPCLKQDPKKASRDMLGCIEFLGYPCELKVAVQLPAVHRRKMTFWRSQNSPVSQDCRVPRSQA